MKTIGSKAVAAFVIGTGFLASAVAAPPSLYEQVSVKVEYADLNIENQAGAEVLYQRLKTAAEEACGFDSHAKERARLQDREAKECFDDTLTEAVDDIQSVALTNIHTS